MSFLMDGFNGMLIVTDEQSNCNFHSNCRGSLRFKADQNDYNVDVIYERSYISLLKSRVCY